MSRTKNPLPAAVVAVLADQPPKLPLGRLRKDASEETSRARYEWLQRLVAAWGGECLSTGYVSRFEPIQLRCANGHEWNGYYQNLIKGRWCLRCRRRIPLMTMEEIRAMAAEKGGDCIGERYVGHKRLLRWRCAEGHEWEATLGHVKDVGRWCRRCHAESRKHTIEKMQEVAATRDGECLSTEYVNADTPLRWRCTRGHEWQASPAAVLGGSWCRKCAFESSRLGIAAMQKLAAERGGECLSTHYTNNHTKLVWRCKLGHLWQAAPSHFEFIKQWCPHCRSLQRKAPSRIKPKLGRVPILI